MKSVINLIFLLFFLSAPAGAIEYVNGVPQTGGSPHFVSLYSCVGITDGVCYNLTDHKLYQWNGSAVVEFTGTGDDLGTATAADVRALWAAGTGFLFTDGTVKAESALSITTSQITDLPTYLDYGDIVALWAAGTGLLKTDGTIDTTTYEPHTTTLTDIGDGTISSDLVNIAFPWSDAEVADDITTDRKIIQVRNVTASPIAAGKWVYLTGGNSQRATIDLASNAAYDSSHVAGITESEIGVNSNGYIVSGGRAVLDTSAFLDGDEQYLGTNGGAVTTKPDAIVVPIGRVIYSNPAVGVIDVSIHYPLVGVNETYGAGWSGDIGVSEKDDIYAYLHLIDTDDDGSLIDETWFTGALALKAPLASPNFTGDWTSTDASPGGTFQDSDNAPGTAYLNANSSGGTNDMVFSFGVMDSTGAGTTYLQLDGVNERINALKPLYLGPITIDGTDDSINNEVCAGVEITGVAGATLVVGDVVYLSDTDGRWELADNDSTTAEANTAKGFVSLAAAADGSATRVCIYGKMRYDTWAWNDNEGQPLYLSSTAGDATETRPISAIEAPQQLGHILSDDEIFIDPQPIDFSRTRTATDADGETLTCLEAQNTLWEVTAAATITGPASSTCPVQNFTICSSVAGAVVYAPNAADDTIVDGTAKGDGVAWTSGSALGDCITITQYDADTLIGLSNGWTAP